MATSSTLLAVPVDIPPKRRVTRVRDGYTGSYRSPAPFNDSLEEFGQVESDSDEIIFSDDELSNSLGRSVGSGSDSEQEPPSPPREPLIIKLLRIQRCDASHIETTKPEDAEVDLIEGAWFRRRDPYEVWPPLNKVGTWLSQKADDRPGFGQSIERGLLPSRR
jgi:hypothetical protein